MVSNAMNELQREGSLEAAVSGALTAPGLDDLAAEYAELGLDGFMDDSIVAELPVAKTILSVVRVGVGIRNRLFARKLLDFLSGFRGVSEWERRDMVSRIEADPGYGRRVGEHLTELLERIETIKKPRMVATIFRAYAENSIDVNMLHRLNHCVERIPVYAIAEVRHFATRKTEKLGSQSRIVGTARVMDFVNAGLVDIGSAIGGLTYVPNDVCQEFVSLDLDKT